MSNEKQQPEQSAVIEVESDEEVPSQHDSNSKSNPISNNIQPRLTIARKKITELTSEEQQQLISDAQNGIDNPFYGVKFFKNGKTRIVLKPQSTSQRIIQEANVNQPVPSDFKRYYTDQQLLLEHVINLEAQYNKLHSKHKKLKKRYNELEGYLYNEDSDDDVKGHNSSEQDSKQVSNQVEQPLQSEQQSKEPPQEVQQLPPPQLQRRFVRSWRDLNRQ